MNLSIYCGRMCSTPKLSIVNVSGMPICVCKYVIAVPDGNFDYRGISSLEEGSVDFFECLAFNQTAKMIAENFVKGSKIVVKGKMKNYSFEDANKTKHVTNIFLSNQVEFGDTDSIINKLSQKNKAADISIVSDLKEIGVLFEKFCKNGYLCLDESDYYNIAARNM